MISPCQEHITQKEIKTQKINAKNKKKLQNLAFAFLVFQLLILGMAKRRTRNQKQEAAHSFSISWDPDNTVKGQKQERTGSKRPQKSFTKNASITATTLELGSIKKEILKSIFIAAFIVSLEVVIYFFGK